jgi:Zn-dependent protease/CBS domain-containing protein
MIGQSVKLTTIRGIDVGIHYSWFIIFFLITFSLTARFAIEHPQWSLFEHYAVGILTSLLFFVSILLHELAHSFVALAKNIPVRSITLFVFGGVAQMGREPDRPLTEFQIAIAGPIASALIAVGFGILSYFATGQVEHLAALGAWLASINLILAIFNLIPGFPLDGGRVFRAALWHLTGSLTKATRIAAGTGQGIGFAFIFFGIWTGFTVNWFGGLWLALIGWFLLNAAQESVLQVNARSVLAGVRIEDIMTRNYPTIPPQMSLADLVHEHILKTGQRCFVVVDEGRLEGLVTLHQIKAIPQSRWTELTVGEAMTPLAELRTVSPETPILEALQAMEGEDVNQMPVVLKGQLLGMITRDHLLRVLSAKMELQSPGGTGPNELSAVKR